MVLGKILYAKYNGTYVLKFIGDIRVNICSSIDSFLDVMFADATLDGVIIDLSETHAIDSTGLGLLVKIAMQLQQLGCLHPTIISTSDDITHILQSMSLDQVFTILTKRSKTEAAQGNNLVELGKVNTSEQRVAARVLEAHRCLMELSEKNKEIFQEVVSLLENERDKKIFSSHQHH